MIWAEKKDNLEEIMTFEELKEEANRQGYNLVKKYQPMPKLLRCPICGRIPKVRYEGNFIYVSCPGWRCLKGPAVNRRAEDGVRLIISKNEAERQARDAWNKMIEESVYGKEC